MRDLILLGPRQRKAIIVRAHRRSIPDFGLRHRSAKVQHRRAPCDAKTAPIARGTGSIARPAEPRVTTVNLDLISIFESLQCPFDSRVAQVRPSESQG